jgi:hypothetical protein
MNDDLKMKPCPKPECGGEAKKAESGRFFLAQDNSGHWYVVPFVNRHEWHAWCDIPEDDERAWTAPPFAQEVGGSPSRVTFLSPEIE